MIRKHRNRTSAASSGRRASNSSAPKTAKRNTQAHSTAPGSVGSKPKATIKQQPKNALTKSAAQSSTASKPKTVPKSTQPNRSRTPQSVPQNFGNKQKIPVVSETISQASAKPLADRLPDGRTMQTYDDYIEDNNGAAHKERRVVIIDGNEKREYAIIPLTSRKTSNTSPLKDYPATNGKKPHFRHFVATADDEGQPIKEGDKFKANPSSLDVGANDLHRIKSKTLKHCKQAQTNQAKIDKLKGKKEKPSDD